jgi:hypothetical protein
MRRADDRTRAMLRAMMPLVDAVVLAGLVAPSTARAFCRTLTTDVPASQQPSGTSCYPAGTTGAPLYWANRCVGWSMQSAASKKVDVAAATTLMGTAFAAWENADCGTGAKPSISLRNNGPVACTRVGFNASGANQHVITFRDDSWPHPGQSNATLALTTLTFNKRTGEIVDADMEVNSAEVTISTADKPPSNAYDFQSIVTHEAGHFIGLAHAVSSTATMFARYSPGQTSIRVLSPDDAAAVCEVYRPNGDRIVSADAAPSGALAALACNAAPFGGFASTCDAPATSNAGAVAPTSTSRRCSYGPISPHDGSTETAVVGGFLVIGALARRRRLP